MAYARLMFLACLASAHEFDCFDQKIVKIVRSRNCFFSFIRLPQRNKYRINITGVIIL
jgi:hypothetical protein